jgi:hypothetical protein
MGYTRGGLVNNGHDIVVPITPQMNSPRTCLGYYGVISSFPTTYLATTGEVLFVVGRVQIDLLEEKYTANCTELIVP